MRCWVRPAAVGDAAGIAAVHVSSWQSAYRGLLPDHVLDGLSTAERRERWTTILSAPGDRCATLVASREREILGFASVGPRRCDAEAPQEGELYALYLHPSRWRRGIGGRLHHAALARLRELGFRAATLWVLVGNERAIGFYRRVGWREDGVTRTDGGPGGVELHEIQLRRELVAERGSEPP